MGVRGLSTFFDNNPHLSKPFKLCNSTVIIDGNNLIHLLYFRSKVDCVYGGDYNRYASSIKKYFSSYITCNIKPLIVFDGGYDKSDRKFKTVLQRNKARLTLTQHIAKYGDCAGTVLPVNAIEVFKHVLEEMGIYYAQCDFEADDQVTALANYYKCPVLSDDSDFYIFDIPDGFIRLSSVDASACEEIANDGTPSKYLKCSIYYIDKFLSYFPGINRHVLPLFGTLVGNDFVNTKDFETFFSNIQLPKSKYKGLKINLRQRKIIGILSWLKDYGLEEGINQVLCRLKKERRDRVKLIIEQSVHGYKIETCNLINILNGNVDSCGNELFLTSKLISPCGTLLPIEFIIAFHQGYLPSFFLNVINLHRVFLPAQVENITNDSSFLCSRPIREVLYGILLQHQSLNPEVHIKCCLRSVREYDRRSGSVKSFAVEPAFELQNGHSVPKLYELYSMDEECLRDLFLNVIGCDKSFFSSLPDDLKLLIGVIHYWLSQSSPGPTEEFVYALILCIIYFNVLQKMTFGGKANKGNQNSSINDICLLIDDISESETQFAAKNLKKYLQKPALNHGNPLILHIVHSYSQLQTCILYFSYLNGLFSYPFRSMKLHKTFCGTMIYNLAKDLLSRPFPDLFVSELLGRESTLTLLFSMLKSKIFKNILPHCFLKIDRSSFQRKKTFTSNKKTKSGKPGVNSEHQETVDCNKFETLCSIEDDLYI